MQAAHMMLLENWIEENTYSNSGQHPLLLQSFRNKCFKIHHLPHVVVHSCSSRINKSSHRPHVLIIRHKSRRPLKYQSTSHTEDYHWSLLGALKNEENQAAITRQGALNHAKQCNAPSKTLKPNLPINLTQSSLQRNAPPSTVHTVRHIVTKDIAPQTWNTKK